MAFDLRITFTGLCFFAYDTSEKKTVHVLMPDTDPELPDSDNPTRQRPHGQAEERARHPHQASTGETRSEHETGHGGVDEGDEDASAPDANAAAGEDTSTDACAWVDSDPPHHHHHRTAVWFDTGHLTGVELDHEYAKKDLEDKFLVFDAQQPSDTNLPEAIIDMSGALGYNPVSSDLVKVPMPADLDARVQLHGGRVTNYAAGGLWRVEKKNGQKSYNKMTFQVEWTIPDYPSDPPTPDHPGDHLVLRFMNRDGGTVCSYPLKPFGGVINLYVECLPDDPHPLGADDIAHHFGYYGIPTEKTHLPPGKRPKLEKEPVKQERPVFMNSDQATNKERNNQPHLNAAANAVTCMVAGGPIG